MALLGAGNYTVTRYAVGSYVDGDWSDTPDLTFTARASIQPLTGQERELLEEGARIRGKFGMWTLSELQICDLDAQQRGDVVSYRGRDYEVIASLDWMDHTRGVPHRAYVLAEVGEYAA